MALKNGRSAKTEDKKKKKKKYELGLKLQKKKNIFNCLKQREKKITLVTSC